jgi:hypothetical protein
VTSQNKCPPLSRTSPYRGCDELDALHLAEVRGVAQHVHEHQLRHVAVPVARILQSRACGGGGGVGLGKVSSVLFFLTRHARSK